MNDTHERPRDHVDLWDRFLASLGLNLEETRQGFVRDRMAAFDAGQAAQIAECHRVIRGIEALQRWIDDELGAEVAERIADELGSGG